CDFNDDASPFCDFRQGGGDHSDWIRHRGPTPTDGTGPSGDYPSGDGYYIYLEADNVANGQGAQFLSPVLLAPGSDLCVQFWFYMYGLDSQNSLAVLVQRPGGEQERLWEEMGAQSHSWLASAVTVPTIPGQQVTVVFKAMRGMSASCDTALDNITISSGACPGTPHCVTLAPSGLTLCHHFVISGSYVIPYSFLTSSLKCRRHPRKTLVHSDRQPGAGLEEGGAPLHGDKRHPASPSTTARPTTGSTAKPTTAPTVSTAKPTTASTVSTAKPSTTTTSKPPGKSSPYLCVCVLQCNVLLTHTMRCADAPACPPARPPPPTAPAPASPAATATLAMCTTGATACPSTSAAAWTNTTTTMSQSPACPSFTLQPVKPLIRHRHRQPLSHTVNRYESVNWTVIPTGLKQISRTPCVVCVATTMATRQMTSALRTGNWSPSPMTLGTAGTRTPSELNTRTHKHANPRHHSDTQACRHMRRCDTGSLICDPSVSLCLSLPSALRCPPNSHYVPCAPPCPESCAPPTPGQCQGPCAEGCVCDLGYALSGGVCVPKDNCGCQYDGNYYQPGEEFFAPGCQKKCRCEGGAVVCVTWQCSSQEVCGVEEGELGCHPTGSSDCVVSGDPHYRTFDGRSYSFMGTCTYTLARSCHNTSGPWFSVEGKNEERGLRGVSYLRKIYITVSGVTVTLMKSRRTLVDGVRVALPHSPSPWLALSLSGQYVTVTTPFGLTVRWDGNHYAHISVPSTYSGQMCGLCGNYDKDPGNDFTRPNGSQAGGSDDFGNSWQTPEDEDESCHPDNGTVPPCDKDMEAEVSKPENCGRLTDSHGPFRDCIAVVDPRPYFLNCVYDMCRYEGLQQTLCDQLQAYTDACLAAGAPVHQWRAPDFCPLSCPPNSHYSLCASVCPESCVAPSLPGGCQPGCVEGCQCDPGFVQSDEQCVALRDCGCLDPQGSYHPVNESWYLPGCGQHCVCQGEGVIRCQNTSCLLTESCQLQDGEYGCQGLDSATCSATGDPHYTSYDGRVHHFQGACTYTLSKACNVSSGLPYFSVETENEHRGNSQTVSYVRAVRVNVYQRAIILGKGRQVQVDGRRVTLPVFPAQGLTVRLSGVFAAVETDFGLHVRFDGNHHADVRVPSSYSGRLCGLCGNYNSQPGDDNLKPDGKPAVSTPELGESWQVPDNRTECSHDGGVDSCDKTVESDAQKPTSCGMITDPQGVFQPCHSVVPPSVYFENCVYDQCGTGGDTVALCLALQSYAALCAQAGVPIDWRNKTFCPLSCPVSSHYSPCGTACPASCTDPSAPSQCPLPCVEGCVCDAGLVLSGDKCVPISQCGCVDKDNNYHPVGESWFPGPGCSERCHCAASNNISCEAWQCTPAEDCAVQEGVLGCHSTGLGVCHVAGDPHYFTFDSVLHTFMGTCTYTLVTVCNSSLLPAFTITAKNEERGQPQASYLRSVTVALPGATVTLAKSGRVLLDGRRVRTPLSITGTGASLSSSGVYNVLNTDFGLTVRFDGVHHLEITVPGAYYDKVCGMCGNFNGNDNDDNLMPNRLPAKDSAQLGNSWKAEGDTDLGCEPDDREDLDPKCTPGEESRYSTLCAELLLDARFGPCHALLPPGPFLHSCLFDLCEYQGMLGRLCDNVEAYAQACQSQGVTVSWRNTTFCPLPCPPNSHYSPCTPPCPSTCANLFAESSCAQPPSACVEGCRCDRGFVLSDGQCVPQSSCGCVDDTGEYHDVGDSWLTNHCERQCRCMLGGVLTCSEFQCSDRSVCDLSSDGIRYCKPDRFVKCTVSGDPHYRTFDGFVHHYQGPDTYVLTQSQQLPGALMPLTVRGRNARRGGSKRVSFLHEVYVDVYGVNVRFLQKRVVLVNGERVWPPMQPAPGLRLFQQSRFLRLHTDFGLAVIFDGHSHGEVTLPSTYRSLVGGLCGNYDGRTNNEYTLPDGSLTRNLNVFGKSWRVSDRDLAHRGPASPPPAAPHVHRRALEEDLESGFETEGCSEENLVAMNGTTQCGALGDPQGPFSACHPALDPAPFQESCVFDLCAEPSDASLRCASYEVYAQACQELGVKLATWREQLQCVLSCPANSVYSPCMSACPATCADLAAPSECDVQYCEEGCQCGASFALSGLDCVPYAQCGCSYLGRYYLV
ncbi:ZAN protein, partial [Amia calva]|nr:ZAN protein [Amia calva]